MRPLVPPSFYASIPRHLYLVPDPDEHDLPRTCVHCDSDISLLSPQARQCPTCKARGMTTTLCRNGCGRYVTRTDQTGAALSRRNICKPCRILMDLERD